MKDPLNLAAIFRQHVRARVITPEDDAELGSMLHRAWKLGREPWPEMDLANDVFVRALAQRLPKDTAGQPLEHVLQKMHLVDFYLACACIHGVSGAVEVLERHHLAELRAALGRFKLPDSMLDDVCQQVRIYLLLGSSEAGPRLDAYTGQGPLKSYVRVIAARTVVQKRPPEREVYEENIAELYESLLTPTLDTELAFVQRRYRPIFLQALREALTTLSHKQRHLFWLHFVRKESTTEMGRMLGVNQSTVSRWLTSAKETVYQETKRRLKERLGLSTRDFESLLADIESQLDLSLSQILEAEPPPGDE